MGDMDRDDVIAINKRLNEDLAQRTRERDGAVKRAEAAEAGAAAIREALDSQEWEWCEASLGYYCVWCDSRKPEHTHDCERQRALSTDAGAALLAVVQAAERYKSADDEVNDIPDDLADSPRYDRAVLKRIECGDALCDALDARNQTH